MREFVDDASLHTHFQFTLKLIFLLLFYLTENICLEYKINAIHAEIWVSLYDTMYFRCVLEGSYKWFFLLAFVWIFGQNWAKSINQSNWQYTPKKEQREMNWFLKSILKPTHLLNFMNIHQIQTLSNYLPISISLPTTNNCTYLMMILLEKRHTRGFVFVLSFFLYFLLSCHRVCLCVLSFVLCWN